MHRPKTERQALAQRLLGTATEPGPLDVGWLKARYGIKGSGISRWREHGIPADRVDDLEAAIAEMTGTTKEPSEPVWVERLLTGVIAIETKEQITSEELALAQAEAAIYLAANSGKPPRPTGGGGGAASNA